MLRRAPGPRLLLRRSRDEAAAAGGGIQGLRGGGEDEGLDPPWAPVVQAQVLRSLAPLKTWRRLPILLVIMVKAAVHLAATVSHHVPFGARNRVLVPIHHQLINN